MTSAPAVQAAQFPIGPVILAACLVIGVVTVVRALRSRARFARVRQGPLYGGSTGARPPGSAEFIVDGAQVRAQELLGALGVPVPSDQDDESDDDSDDDDDENDDGGTGAILGLRYHRYRHSTSDLSDPIVYDGTRLGHQVFIRLGRNAAVRGPGMNMRRLRSVCAVRVSTPAFELVADGGLLRARTALPPAVARVLAQLHPSPDVWHDLRVVGGPDGLVTSRGIAQDWVGGWIYDLWLLERLAGFLAAPPLPPVTLGRAWTPPYGLGDWAPPLGETLLGS